MSEWEELFRLWIFGLILTTILCFIFANNEANDAWDNDKLYGLMWVIGLNTLFVTPLLSVFE